MEASDSTTSFFLSPEQQDDADSFFLSRGVGAQGLARASGSRCLVEDAGLGWAERFRIFHADVMPAAEEDFRPDARSAELAARQCVQDVSIRSLCAALVSVDTGQTQTPPALPTPEPPELPEALELLDAPAVDGSGRTSEKVWSLEEMSVASEVVREVRRPMRPMCELAGGPPGHLPPSRPPPLNEHATAVQSPPRPALADLAPEPARPPALADSALLERPRPPPLDVDGMEPEQEEEGPTHYFFGEQGWQPVQVVEMEMPVELAMAGAAYGYYSVVQDQDRLEVGPAVPDAHVYAVPPPEPPPALPPAPPSPEVLPEPSSPASSEPAAGERPPSAPSRPGGNPRRVRARGKRPEQGRSRPRADAPSKADAPGQILLFGNAKPSFATVETASSWRKRSDSPWDRADSRTSSWTGRPTPSTRPSTRDSSAGGAAVQGRAPETWALAAAVDIPMGQQLGNRSGSWPERGVGAPRPVAQPPEDEDSDEEEAARREMAEVEAEFELYPFAKPAAAGGGQLRSLRLLQELKR